MSHIISRIFSPLAEPITRATEIGKTSLLPLIGAAVGGPLGAAAGTFVSGVGNDQPLGQNLLNSAISGGTSYLSGVGSDLIGGGLDSLESSLGGTGSFGNDTGLNNILGNTTSSSPVTSSGLNGITNPSSGGLASGGGSSSFADIGKSFTNDTDSLLNNNSLLNGANASPAVSDSTFTGGSGYNYGQPQTNAFENSRLNFTPSASVDASPAIQTGISSADSSSPSFLSRIGNNISSTYNDVANPISNAFNTNISQPISDAYHSLGFGNSNSAGGFLSNQSAKLGGNVGTPGLFGSSSNLANAGTLLGDLNSYFSQNKIADQQKQGFAQAQSYLSPFYNTGTGANTQLANLLGTNGAAAGQSATDALLNDPGYQFRLQQGQKALDQNLAAQGLTGSGAAIKGTSDYNQGAASQEYQQAIANLTNQSNQGLQAGAALGNYANLSGQANAAATGQQNNVINQGLGSLFGSNQSPYSQLIQQLLGKSSFA